ncbi:MULTISPECIES: hypothetical protein [unclassified Rickettsia]|uniref:hypothetical protein n=1 Tax=unclassified Rickettsia TaxID=114295 RepID=UPI0031332A37
MPWSSHGMTPKRFAKDGKNYYFLTDTTTPSRNSEILYKLSNICLRATFLILLAAS